MNVSGFVLLALIFDREAKPAASPHCFRLSGCMWLFDNANSAPIRASPVSELDI